MGLLLATMVVLVFATFVVSVLRLPSRIATLVGLYLLAYGNVVLVAEVTATAHMLNPNAFLFLHLALAIAAWMLWNRAGRPPLVWHSVSIRSVLSPRSVLSSLRSDPGLWALGLGVTVAYLIGGGLILRVPPNNVDSLAYHLSRVGYWLQHNSFYPWPTPNPGQISFPLNAEVGVLWTVLFVGTDRLAGFVQWSAAGASMAAIAGLSRFFGASRAQALFAALLWATLPEIVLQSTTPQNDLLTGAFFASGLYLLYLGLHSRHIGALLLSSLALGLALGTKFTVLFLLPGLAATIVILSFGNKRRRATLVLTWMGASLVAFLLVGVYVFALNVLVHRHPLGLPSLRSDLGGFSASRVQMMIVNVPRHLYQNFDTTGLPDSWAEPLHGLKVRLGSEVFPLVNGAVRALALNSPGGRFDLYRRAPVHEDFAGFGPLSILVLMPAVIYQAFVALARKDPFRAGVILISLSMLLGVSFWRWSYPFDNRYFVLVATICAPLVAPIFTRKRRHAALQWGIAGVALLVLGWTTTHNLSKPLLGARPVWEMDSIERQTINRRSMEPVLRAVERLIPHDSSIGVITGKGGWHYPLFGRRFGRTVLSLFPAPAIIDPGWLQEQDVAFVLVDEGSGTYVSHATAALHTIWNSGPWYILYRGEADFNAWDARLKNLLLEVNRTSVLTLDQSLAQGVGIGEFTPPPWGEDYPGGFIWLGQGDEEGIDTVLWSDRDRMVEFTFDVAPGPGRPDAVRTVYLTLENGAAVQRLLQELGSSTTLSFAVQLHPGRNDVTFGCLDEATVLQQPNGDTRPLLVRLNASRVTSLLSQRQAGPADAPLVVLDSALAGVVGILSRLDTPPWDIEVYDDGSLLWLGQGDAEAMRATLWSEREVMVDMAFDVVPGPARVDAARSVYLTLEYDAGVQRQRQRFDGSTTLSFALQLQPGRNEFTFGCLDEVTVLEQPNGDTRPLLVRLEGISIASPLGRGQAGPPDSPLVVVDSALAGVVGILLPLETPPWDIEVYDDGTLLWLGQGDDQGIRAVLWSGRQLTVELVFDVAPGPGRVDAGRSVYLTLENDAGVQRRGQRFDGSTTLSFAFQLQPGRNEFTFGCLDEATVLEQPNGDTRPLLVLLREVRIEPLVWQVD